MKQDFLIDHLGHKLALYSWIPEGKPRAWVHLLHGMMDHARRYDHLAAYLNSQGVLVTAQDHRGHGETSKHSLGYLGYAADWDTLVLNVNQAISFFEKQYEKIPLFLLGHSMGSFLALSYCQRFGGLSGLILSGASFQSPLLTQLGASLSRMNALCLGAQNKAFVLHALVFLPYVYSVKNHRTNADWISRDTVKVDAYMQDPYCQFICSSSFYQRFFSGLTKLFSHRSAPFKQSNLPILLLSGSKDPVGGMGRNLKLLEAWLKREPHLIHKHIYNGARHEVFNEINRQEVFEDMRSWIEDKL